jgi:hypothetical protein
LSWPQSWEAAISQQSGSAGKTDRSIVGWGTIPLKNGMAVVLSWPLLRLRYDQAGVYLKVRPGLLSGVLRGSRDDFFVAWSEISRFQYSGGSVAWLDGVRQLCRFATYSDRLSDFVEVAQSQGVSVEPVRSTYSRAWTLE